MALSIKNDTAEREPPIMISTWAEITKHLDDFPPPEIAIDSEGEIAEKTWVFRGLKSSSYKLEPTIEREAHSKNTDWAWASLESRAKHEFKARAPMHLSTALIPADEDKLTWLALMQHYGAPTRLLDFTYSPFVALYFAIRDGYEKNDRTHARLCAMDAGAVYSRFQSVTQEPREFLIGGSLNPDDDLATQHDSMEADIQDRHTSIVEALSARGARRREMNRKGCVGVASPPTFNPRLASQQGAFLLNCAEDFNFEESLTKMMEPYRGEWRKTFDIPIDDDLIPEIEGRLFQMNIHEQSLFPDMEGLAGLIRQKIRLHWK